jgi:hypothetical protein
LIYLDLAPVTPAPIAIRPRADLHQG